MKIAYTIAVPILALFSHSLTAVAQNVSAPMGTNATEDNSEFRIGIGPIVGAMNSQGMLGAYLYLSTGKSRIDLSIAEEASLPSGSNFFSDAASPEPSFDRIAITYGRAVAAGFASVVFAAGPEYSWGVADGKYLYRVNSTGFVGPGTNYCQTIPISRLGISLDANLALAVSRHFGFGFRSSLTIDKVGSYGLFGMTFGIVFN